MELRYQFVVYIGIGVDVLLLLLLLIRFRRKKRYRGGKKIANTIYSENNQYFQKRMILFRIMTVAMVAFSMLGILVSSFMIARPYRTKVTNRASYSRDIMLCLDISTSVDNLNAHLVGKLKDTVRNLEGERFGIVIFNTSPVLLTPLTDDYEYVIEQLDLIEECLMMRLNYLDYENGAFWTWNLPDDWYYKYEYISAGTLVGNELRGSSLIGDGLAGCAYDFTDAEEDRSRIIIFSTDNCLEGNPIVTLDVAADICKKKEITVYGVGTKEMYDYDMESMKAAVEKTGGQFYLEEESGTFGQIVSEIEKASASLIDVDYEITKEEKVQTPFVILLCCITAMFACIKLTKR